MPLTVNCLNDKEPRARRLQSLASQLAACAAKQFLSKPDSALASRLRCGYLSMRSRDLSYRIWRGIGPCKYSAGRSDLNRFWHRITEAPMVSSTRPFYPLDYRRQLDETAIRGETYRVGPCPPIHGCQAYGPWIFALILVRLMSSTFVFPCANNFEP